MKTVKVSRVLATDNGPSDKLVVFEFDKPWMGMPRLVGITVSDYWGNFMIRGNLRWEDGALIWRPEVETELPEEEEE